MTDSENNSIVPATTARPSRYYKWCIVPMCTNSTYKTPNKLFISVPRNAKRRKTWIKAINFKRALSLKSALHCCEDHFKLEEDMENYVRFKLTGGQIRVRMKENAIPHLFDCQSRDCADDVPRKHKKRGALSSRQAFVSTTGSDMDCDWPDTDGDDDDPFFNVGDFLEMETNQDEDYGDESADLDSDWNSDDSRLSANVKREMSPAVETGECAGFAPPVNASQRLEDPRAREGSDAEEGGVAKLKAKMFPGDDGETQAVVACKRERASSCGTEDLQGLDLCEKEMEQQTEDVTSDVATVTPSVCKTEDNPDSNSTVAGQSEDTGSLFVCKTEIPEPGVTEHSEDTGGPSFVYVTAENSNVTAVVEQQPEETHFLYEEAENPEYNVEEGTSFVYVTPEENPDFDATGLEPSEIATCVYENGDSDLDVAGGQQSQDASFAYETEYQEVTSTEQAAYGSEREFYEGAEGFASWETKETFAYEARDVDLARMVEGGAEGGGSEGVYPVALWKFVSENEFDVVPRDEEEEGEEDGSEMISPDSEAELVSDLEEEEEEAEVTSSGPQGTSNARGRPRTRKQKLTLRADHASPMSAGERDARPAKRRKRRGAKVRPTDGPAESDQSPRGEYVILDPAYAAEESDVGVTDGLLQRTDQGADTEYVILAPTYEDAEREGGDYVVSAYDHAVREEVDYMALVYDDTGREGTDNPTATYEEVDYLEPTYQDGAEDEVDYLYLGPPDSKRLGEYVPYLDSSEKEIEHKIVDASEHLFPDEREVKTAVEPEERSEQTVVPAKRPPIFPLPVVAKATYGPTTCNTCGRKLRRKQCLHVA